MTKSGDITIIGGTYITGAAPITIKTGDVVANAESEDGPLSEAEVSLIVEEEPPEKYMDEWKAAFSARLRRDHGARLLTVLPERRGLLVEVATQKRVTAATAARLCVTFCGIGTELALAFRHQEEDEALAKLTGGLDREFGDLRSDKSAENGTAVTGTAKTRRFRVALSFAGELRPFVAEIARLLADHFTPEQILYDKFHEAEFARANLSRYLPDLYHKEADLVVVIACPKYDQKEWTGLEWRAIHNLLQQRRDEEVMLCRFGLATISGLHGGEGWIELEDRAPLGAVHLILQRFALNNGLPRDTYLTEARAAIPAVPHLPPVSVPMPTSMAGAAGGVKFQINIHDLPPVSPGWQDRMRSHIRVETGGAIQLFGKILDGNTFSGPNLIFPLYSTRPLTEHEKDGWALRLTESCAALICRIKDEEDMERIKQPVKRPRMLGVVATRRRR